MKPWQSQHWVIGELNTNFIARMEMVLDVYERPYDPARPVVCLDERPGVLRTEVVEPLPAKPGAPERRDYEYKREGTYNAFMMVEPLGGRRHVDIRARRCDEDFAAQLIWLCEEGYPEADEITVVLDNLSTHRLETLWKVVEPARAIELQRRLRLVFTPVHGSWLNMAELELSIMERQALNGDRLGSLQEVRARIDPWQQERNEQGYGIDWGFGLQACRTKFERFYEEQELM